MSYPTNMFHVYINGYFDMDYWGYDNAVNYMLDVRKEDPEAKVELYEVTTQKELLYV